MFNKKIKKALKSELIDENGKAIACFIITPETDLNNKRLNAIILVPKEVLCFNTKYTVNIEVKTGEHQENNTYKWSFTTENSSTNE